MSIDLVSIQKGFEGTLSASPVAIKGSCHTAYQVRLGQVRHATFYIQWPVSAHIMFSHLRFPCLSNQVPIYN